MFSLGDTPVLATASVSRQTVKAAAKKSIALFNLILSAALLRTVVLDSSVYPTSTSPLALLLGALYAFALILQLSAAMLPRATHTPALLSSHTLASAAALRVAARAACAVDVRKECVALAIGDWPKKRVGVWGPDVSGVMVGDEAVAFCNRQIVRDDVLEVLMLAASLVMLGFAVALVVVGNAEKDREEEARRALLECECDCEYVKSALT